MNSAGVTPRSLAHAWQFSVEIAGFDPAFFQKADLPEVQMEEANFAPAGSLFDQKTASRVKYEDLKLEKAVPQENTETNILTWIRQMITVAAGIGAVPRDYMRDVDVVVYDRTGSEIKRYRFFGAFVKTAKFGSLDGSSSENVIEELTLCYQYFDLV